MPHPRPSTVPSRPAATRRRLERTLAAGLGLLLALPLVQQLTGFPRDLPLTGAEARTPPPTWSAAAWFDGTFAAQAEQWSLERIGFRGLLIHLATQANYSLFGRIGLPGGTEVVEGRDHWLFERAYIKWAMRPQGYSQARAASFADQAARLQEALARRGIAFALVLAPSKAEIMADRLPPDITLPPRAPDGFYDRLAPALRARGVALLDGPQLFLNWKQADPGADLFPAGGVHWSTWAAWQVWRELAGLFRRQPGLADLPDSPVRERVWSRPLGADADLRNLLNLWHFEPGGPRPIAYPLVAPPPAPHQGRYAALVVGDSFALTLIDAMCRSGLFRQIDLLYYFNRRLTYPAPSFAQSRERLIAPPGIDMGPFRPADLDWEQLLENRQMVILVLNVIHIKAHGWGFPESLHRALTDAPPPT